MVNTVLEILRTFKNRVEKCPNSPRTNKRKEINYICVHKKANNDVCFMGVSLGFLILLKRIMYPLIIVFDKKLFNTPKQPNSASPRSHINLTKVYEVNWIDLPTFGSAFYWDIEVIGLTVRIGKVNSSVAVTFEVIQRYKNGTKWVEEKSSLKWGIARELAQKKTFKVSPSVSPTHKVSI